MSNELRITYTTKLSTKDRSLGALRATIAKLDAAGVPSNAEVAIVPTGEYIGSQGAAYDLDLLWFERSEIGIGEEDGDTEEFTG